MIRWYVPHRQTLPFIAVTMSSRFGFGFLLSSALADISIPEVQYAHCIASALIKASCNGVSLPSFSKPSIVVICFPAARATWVMHERVATPSISTVHAPHWPSPQPYLLPVKSRSLRKTDSRLTVESTSTVTFFPLTLRLVILTINTSSIANHEWAID